MSQTFPRAISARPLLSIVLVSLCGGFVTSANAQSWLGFSDDVTYPVGSSPEKITHGDFNEDGILDLVVTNYSGSNISVLLGNGSGGVGDGTFASQVTYSVGANPLDVKTGDFDDDGIMDLVVTNGGSGNVSVLLGNGSGGVGDGTFASQVTYAVAGAPRGVALGDFNSDGITDLVATNGGTNNISVLLGNGSGGVGDGTFATGVTYSVGSSPNGVATGDFNGDGVTDVVAVNNGSGNISVLLGNGSGGVGDGTFASQVTYSVFSGPLGVATDDFNDDGITDLVIGRFGNTQCAVMRGIEDSGNLGFGDGTFATRVTYTSGYSPRYPKTGDFNNDGITDIVWGVDNSNNIRVLPGEGAGGVGDGTFGNNIPFDTDGTQVICVTAGDFNGDGNLDIAAVDRGDNNVSVLLNLGLAPDVTDPISAVTGPTGTVTTSTFNVAYTASDSESGVDTVELFYRFNSGTYTSYGTFSSSPISFDTSGTGGDGDYDFYTVATDNEANTEAAPGSADVSVTVDTTAPTSAATGPAGTQTTSTFNVIYTVSDSGSGVDTIELFYRHDGGTYTSYGSSASSPISFTAAEGDGDYDFYTVATDNAGNTEAAPGSADVSVTVDTTAPTVSSVSLVGTPAANATSIQFMVTFNESAVNVSSDDFQLTTTGGATGVISAVTGSGTTRTVTVNTISGNGSLRLDLKGSTNIADTNGNTPPAAFTGGDVHTTAFDTTAPTSAATSPTGTLATSTFNVAYTANDSESGVDTVELFYRFNSGSYTSFGTFSSSPISFDTSGTGGDGDYDFYTVATDNAGNTEAAPGTADVSTTVDTTAPASAVTGPSGNLTQPSSTFDVVYTASDSGSGVADVELFYQRDGGGYTSYGVYTTSPISFDTSTTGGDGTYDFYTVATDVAGNTETAPISADVSVIFNDVTSIDEWSVLND